MDQDKLWKRVYALVLLVLFLSIIGLYALTRYFQ